MVMIWCDMKRCKWHSPWDDLRCDLSVPPRLENGVCSKLEACDAQLPVDPVNSPAHYAGDGKITCKDALRSMVTGAEVSSEEAYWWGCILKYVWRWPHKHGREDLEKARKCIDYLLEAYDG